MSGLTFLNNRHYDPTVGVFISVDPLVTMTGQPYIYGAANPVTYADPSGLCIEPGSLSFNADGSYDYTPMGGTECYNATVEDEDYVPDDGYGVAAVKRQKNNTGRPTVGHAPLNAKNVALLSGAVLAGAAAIAAAPVVAAKASECALYWALCKTWLSGVGTPGAIIGNDVANGAPTSPAAVGAPIALGLADDLDDFARAHGALTYKSWSSGQFADDFMRVVGDSSNDVRFNLDGLRSPMGSVGRGGDADLRRGPPLRCIDHGLGTCSDLQQRLDARDVLQQWGSRAEPVRLGATTRWKLTSSPIESSKSGTTR